jgi:methylmalonyl-CoA/ethylmalonyl-CoA epimerase
MFENYKLHHVGVVLPSFEEADSFMKFMGFKEDFRGFVEHWSAWCIFTCGQAGTTIELVVPKGGKLARFNKGLAGVHHFAFQVEDIADAQRWSEQQGMRMIEPKAIKGAGDFLCNFLSPASTRGIQIEFVQLLTK